MNEFTVYGLVDARRPWKIKYVGATTRSPNRRLAGHLQGTGSQKLAQWFSSVPKVELIVLETVSTKSEMLKAEQRWIAWARLFGPVLNSQLGDFNGKNRFNQNF